MNASPVSPVEVRRQIWESLVSMLRVYTYAAGLNSEAYAVASHAETAWLTYGESLLEIRSSADTGAAHWLLKAAGREIEGTFRIDNDGHLLFPEGEKDLDEAAIHWVELLGSFPVQTNPSPESPKTS